MPARFEQLSWPGALCRLSFSECGRTLIQRFQDFPIRKELKNSALTAIRLNKCFTTGAAEVPIHPASFYEHVMHRLCRKDTSELISLHID